MKKAGILCIVVVLIFAQTSSVFAASKTEESYYAPYGTVPDLGLVVSWGITLKLTLDYTRISDKAGTRLESAQLIASITPKQSDSAGNGKVDGNLKVTADGVSSTMALHSLPNISVWSDPNTHIYLAKEYRTSRVFTKSCKVTASTAFSNLKAPLLFNTTGDVSVKITH